MLQQINDNAKGCLAYGIVGLIIFAFAFVGVGSYLNSSSSVPAAIVNGEEIPLDRVQNYVTSVRRVNPNNEGVKEQALEGFIESALWRQQIEKGDYRASNQEVYDELITKPEFQKEGVFDAATYAQSLGSVNKVNYENGIRDQITYRQASRGISKTAFVPKSELARYQQLQNQTRTAETYIFDKSDFTSQVDISDDEVKTYYTANLSNFKTTEKVKLRYILLSQDELAKKVDISEDALRATYEDSKQAYVEPEQRKVAHIVVKVDENTKDLAAARKKGKEKAQALYDQIKAGTKTFEVLASTSSDDPDAAKKSGEIGLIALGDMDADFEKAAFSLKKGELSEVVETVVGFEIIKVLDIVAKKQKSFDDVKSDVEKTYRRDEAEKLFIENTDLLKNLVFENDDSLDFAASELGLKVQTSEWLKKGTAPTKSGLFSSVDVLRTAFSDTVLSEGKNSVPLDIDAKTVVAIRSQDHKLPEQKPQNVVTPEIKKILLEQKLRKLVLEKGETALNALQISGDWAELTKVGGSMNKVVKQANIKRTNRKLSPLLINRIFSTKKPQADKSSFSNAILNDGNYVIVKLLEVKEGTEKVDRISQQVFSQMLAEREQTAIKKALRDSAKVELFLDRLQ